MTHEKFKSKKLESIEKPSGLIKFANSVNHNISIELLTCFSYRLKNGASHNKTIDWWILQLRNMAFAEKCPLMQKKKEFRISQNV